jgi:hypothetical protein
MTLSCIMFRYLVICCKKIPVFYDKSEDGKDIERVVEEY